MKRTLALVALALGALALPASAASQFVQDGASMFSSSAASQIESRVSALQSQTGKEVVVVTVPSLNGETVAQAAQTVFNEQHINGVLIFIAKEDRKDIIVPGTATAQFFNASTNTDIRQSMESAFKAGDYDGGITGAVTSIVDLFNAHANTAPGNQQSNNAYPVNRPQRYVRTSSGGGFHLSMFWWIVIIVVGFLILRSIMRAASGPRYYGGQPMGGPGYGGYGPGYGGGGGFWSGLLGGLGGAWLGNELFGGNRGIGGGDGGYYGGDQGNQGGGWGGNDGGNSGGWGSDSGADMGNSSGGDFSGGGFGGDGGGGGGDGGGGW